MNCPDCGDECTSQGYNTIKWRSIREDNAKVFWCEICKMWVILIKEIEQ